MSGIIFFYDGDCGFCNKTVMFLLDRTPHTFRFCSLQSKFAEETLKKFGVDQINIDTAYLLTEDRIYKKSTAIMKSLTYINSFYKGLSITMMLIPKSFRDGVYGKFAENRLRVSTSNCRILNKDERSRFIG